MKPNRRLAQRLGALVLSVAGVLLAGCGGRLTDVDGGSQLPDAQPGTHFWLSGTVYLEQQATTRALASGDFRLGGATVRVLRRTQGAVYLHGTTTADAEGHYSIEVNAPVNLSASDLWEVEAFATGVRFPQTDGSTVITNVLVLGVLMPASGGVFTRDLTIASTIVAGNMEAQLGSGGRPGILEQSVIASLDEQATTVVRGLSTGATPVRLSAVSTQQGNPDDAHGAVMTGITESVVSVFGRIVSQVRILVNGTPASQVILPPTGSVTLTGQALDSAGNPVSAAIDFTAESGGGYVTVVTSGTNRVTVTGRLAGTAVLVGRVSAPGTIDLAPKQGKVTVIVGTHPQGTVITQ